jgi:hypothetical protein
MEVQNNYLCYKDEKENISDDLLEIAGRGKAESSNSNEPEILFSFLVNYRSRNRPETHGLPA